MAFRHAHASAGDARTVVRLLLDRLGPGPYPRGPGFLYFTEALASVAGAILRGLRESTGVERWVGSVGVGVIGGGIEYLDQPAASVLLADWAGDDYRVFSGKSRPPRTDARTATGATAAQFAIVHADPATPDIPDLIEDMSTKVESGFVVGGLSSAGGGDTWQVADEVLQGGLSGLVVSSAVRVATRLTQGCSPLPGRHVVTEGERNVIVAIDGRPALDVFREVAGVRAEADLARAARTTLVGLPVRGADSGRDYLVRDIVGIDPRAKVVAIGAEVERGMPLLFCRRDGASARADLERMLDDLVPALPGPPLGALYFSCLGRGEHMFGERSVEAGIVSRRLGDVPLAGFFAAGETARPLVRLHGRAHRLRR